MIIGRCLFLFLVTCSSNSDEHVVPAFKVDAKAKAVIENASVLEDILEPVAEIQLENSEEALIGEFSEFSVGPEEQFIIIDRTMRRMLIFNRLGRWLHTVTYDDILGPGKKYTRICKAVFWSNRELLVSFLNIPYLYLVNLDSPSSVGKILVKDNAHIVNFVVAPKKQILTLIFDYSRKQQAEFRLMSITGKTLKEVKEMSSNIMPNLFALTLSFNSLTLDQYGFAYFSNSYEPKVYKYDFKGKSKTVFSQNPPLFAGPANDIPPGMSVSIKKQVEEMQNTLLDLFLLDNGLLIVAYAKRMSVFYNFVDINGEWLTKPFQPTDREMYIAAVSGYYLYSIIQSEPDDDGNFGNPKIFKFRISEDL
ncbi:MAG: hypothetical protein ACE5HI_16625 [bacterium]